MKRSDGGEGLWDKTEGWLLFLAKLIKAPNITDQNETVLFASPIAIYFSETAIAYRSHLELELFKNIISVCFFF